MIPNETPKQKVETEPNQALQRTPVAVTLSAVALIAPPPVVSDL
jgi:hypothetical protein